MHFFGLFLFGLIALFWLTHGLRVAYGAFRLPWLKNFSPADDSDCPRISLIFAARNEEEKLPAALATLIEIDYPNLEIIAVDDRSNDATGRILDEAAVAHPRLRIVHVTELPPNWLGKPHALQKAFETSTGDWLLFTDADVRFQPDVLRRAVTLTKQRGLDHLTLFGEVEMASFGEKVLITFMGFGFHLATDSFRVNNPRSRAYAGVGAFQLLRRSAYETSGMHRRLAMEVVDDMKLGKIVKQSGFRSEVAFAQDSIAVRWHAGIGNLIRGVTKNFFAVADFSLAIASAQIAGLFALSVLPFAGLFFGQGWIRVFAAVAVFIAVCFHAVVATIVMRVSPFYALTQPLGAVLMSYMIARSAFVTVKQGGIVWRDTFYPLEDLKRGSV
jgi:glycosyltransferase involved in cell wall biosynthesis